MLEFLLTVVGLCFCPNDDKIEKKGTLLNSTCTGFGTRCSAVTSSAVLQYSYWVNESGARLILVVTEKEAATNPLINGLVKNKKMLELKEPIILPSDVCSKLQLSTGYAIPVGNYTIQYQNNEYRIYLIPEK